MYDKANLGFRVKFRGVSSRNFRILRPLVETNRYVRPFELSSEVLALAPSRFLSLQAAGTESAHKRYVEANAHKR
jgi:hypothetical protein